MTALVLAEDTTSTAEAVVVTAANAVSASAIIATEMAVTCMTVPCMAVTASYRNCDGLWNQLANGNFDFFLYNLRNANLVGFGACFWNALVDNNINNFFLSGVLNNVASARAGFGFANSASYLAGLGLVNTTSNLGGYSACFWSADVLGNLLGASFANESALANLDVTNFITAKSYIVSVRFFALLWLIAGNSNVFSNKVWNPNLLADGAGSWSYWSTSGRCTTASVSCWSTAASAAATGCCNRSCTTAARSSGSISWCAVSWCTSYFFNNGLVATVVAGNLFGGCYRNHTANGACASTFFCVRNLESTLNGFFGVLRNLNCVVDFFSHWLANVNGNFTGYVFVNGSANGVRLFFNNLLRYTYFVGVFDLFGYWNTLGDGLLNGLLLVDHDGHFASSFFGAINGFVNQSLFGNLRWNHDGLFNVGYLGRTGGGACGGDYASCTAATSATAHSYTAATTAVCINVTGPQHCGQPKCKHWAKLHCNLLDD